MHTTLKTIAITAGVVSAGWFYILERHNNGMNRYLRSKDLYEDFYGDRNENGVDSQNNHGL